MKLRYLKLANYGPLKDVTVLFSASSPLNRSCSIRFVVGVNGSGKTHLLKALSEIFLALADWLPPHFPVTLIYELGGGIVDTTLASPDEGLAAERVRTVILHSPGRRNLAGLWVSDGFTFPPDADKETLEMVIKKLSDRQDKLPYGFRAIISRGTWTGKALTPQMPYLPKSVLAYTTGTQEPWVRLWTPMVDSEGADVVSQDLEYDAEALERPAGWNYENELEKILDDEDSEDDPEEFEKLKGGNGEGRAMGAWQPLLLDSLHLKCAVLAVTLTQALEDLETVSDESKAKTLLEELRIKGESLPGLRGLLARGGWAWPVSVMVRQARLNDEKFFPQDKRLVLDWLSRATHVVSEPKYGTLRTLWFDIGAKHEPMKVPEKARWENEDSFLSCGAALLNLIGGGESAFERFKLLLELLERDVIRDLNIMVRKTDHADILSFDELSDGEQMVLCRMALFHLLKGRDDVLLLLDEPETHFNDKWKRDVVDIIDEAIGDTANEVVISTHAALVLTDALKDEIILMKPVYGEGAKVLPLGDDVHTFGATSDHPLRDVFDAQDTVGRRASKLLEVMLAAAAHAEAVEKLWADELSDDEKEATLNAVLTTASATEEGLNEAKVADCLMVAARFAEHFGVQKPLKMPDVLESFIEQTGPGYFKIELMRAWRRLKERPSDVA